VSLRLRLTVLASVAVAVAIAGTSVFIYYTDKSELLNQVDSDLRISMDVPQVRTAIRSNGPLRTITKGSTNFVPGKAVGLLGISGGKGQIVGRGMAVTVQIARRKQMTLPAHPPQFTTAKVGDVKSRVLTIETPFAKILLSRPLSEIDSNLAHLRWLLIFVSLGGIGIAAILGALVSGAALAPLRRLTATTEEIVETRDLTRRVATRGRDEISRLSRRLDELLATLDDSLRTQRQLVADASHELRTPIATLRANVELLAGPATLDASERAELVSDVRDELESMTALVGELVELARGEEADVDAHEFRLDEVVQNAADRAARRAPSIVFRTALEPTTVVGVPERIERAVANLLDNARKWSPVGETVDVSVRDGLVEVRDRGPGVDPEDAPLVFNRFYRSAKARGTPGAGLGLAIVKQIADAHGGTVTVDRGRDGGAIVRLRLSATR
jgi:two-component system, OmpR family, sensor histidine kinase MprB